MTRVRALGGTWVLSDSAIRGENITHATDGTHERTLCGRRCAGWTREAPSDEHPPDCLVCAKIWRVSIDARAVAS